MQDKETSSMNSVFQPFDNGSPHNEGSRATLTQEPSSSDSLDDGTPVHQPPKRMSSLLNDVTKDKKPSADLLKQLEVIPGGETIPEG